MPRWKRFLWQGGVLIALGLVLLTDAPGLGIAIAVLGGLLLLAGLIGGAVSRD